MDSVEESISVLPAAKLLVGVSLDGGESSQLLAWSVTVAHPNDTIVALHVLGWYQLAHQVCNYYKN